MIQITNSKAQLLKNQESEKQQQLTRFIVHILWDTHHTQNVGNKLKNEYFNKRV